jgi:c-di-GMP-binding flagellar brake protein YcgR
MNRPEEQEFRINKRRYPRYELDAELRATVFGSEKRGEVRGRCLNISEAGIAGVFTTGWEVGTPVNLEFSVPVTSSQVMVAGVVRSHTNYRYGFEFIDLKTDQYEVICKTCRTLALLQ